MTLSHYLAPAKIVVVINEKKLEIEMNSHRQNTINRCIQETLGLLPQVVFHLPETSQNFSLLWVNSKVDQFGYIPTIPTEMVATNEKSLLKAMVTLP